jgi:hypothetical protein
MRKALALLIACACFAQPPAQKKDAPQKLRSFLIWLAQVSGLSATSSGLRALNVDHQGDIWSEPITGGARQRLTFEGAYSWPIFSSDDRSVIALHGSDLWSTPLNGGSPVKLAHTLPGITSLLGSGPEGIVVLTADQIGTFLPDSGLFTPFPPASQEDRETIDRLRAPIRSYDQGQLTVSSKSGAILIDNHGQKRKLAPENATVWQPSVSHDGKRLVYIRTDDSRR